MKSKTMYRLSLICGIGPLALAAIVFLLWFFFGLGGPIELVILWFLGWAVYVLIGLLFLAYYLWSERIITSGRILVAKGLLSFILLIANVPAAVNVSSVMISVPFLNSATIQNESSESLDDAVIAFAEPQGYHSAKINLGHIDGGGRVLCSFPTAYYQAILSFSATLNGRKIDSNTNSVITGGQHFLVQIDPNGNLTVSRQNPRPTPYQLVTHRRNAIGQ
jgi:hypothetical protein